MNVMGACLFELDQQGAYVPYTFLRFTHVAVDYSDSSLPRQKIMELMPAIYFSAFLVDNRIDSFKPKKGDSAEIDGRYCPEKTWLLDTSRCVVKWYRYFVLALSMFLHVNIQIHL